MGSLVRMRSLDDMSGCRRARAWFELGILEDTSILVKVNRDCTKIL